MNNVRYDQQVLINELRWVGVVGVNAAHSARCDENVFRALALKEAIYGLLLREIELIVRAGDEIVVAASL